MRPLEDTQVRELDSITLECDFRGQPTPEVTWYFEGRKIRTSTKYRVYSDDSHTRLTLLEATMADAGEYTVDIRNTAGTKKTSGRLTVRPAVSREPPPMDGEAPRVVERLADIEIMEGYDVGLSCKITGDPVPKIQWLFDRKPITSFSNKIQMKQTDHGKTYMLTIKDATPADLGIYTCKATNQHGEATTSAFLNVLAGERYVEADQKRLPISAPHITRGLRDTEVIKGENLQLECRVVCDSEFYVNWYKDGIELGYEEHRINRYQLPNGKVSIEIRDSALNDTGYYSVSVYNGAGKATSSAQVTVDAPRFASQPRRSVEEVLMNDRLRRRIQRIHAIPPQPIEEAPRVISHAPGYYNIAWEPHISEFEPHIPTFYVVEMRGRSEPDWVRIQQGITTSLVTVQVQRPDDDYLFRVRAENIHGTSDPSPVAFSRRDVDVDIALSKDRFSMPGPQRRTPLLAAHPIYVPYHDHLHPEFSQQFSHDPYSDPPKIFSKGPEINYVPENHPVMLEAWVSGHPTPLVKWLFKGQEIKTGGHYTTRVNPSGHVQLLIDRMNLTDAGEYLVLAQNKSGHHVLPIRIDVADPPVFIEPMIDSTIVAKRSARFDCRIDGTPFPEVRWMKDWQTVVDSARIKIESAPGGYTSLIITDVLARDAGLYTCEAKNPAGTALCTINVHVEQYATTYTDTDVFIRRIRPKRKRLADFYDLQEEIMRGTQGVVKRVIEKSSGKAFAAKISFAEQRHFPLLENELHILNELSHKNIIAVHDAFEGSKSMTVIMEYARGGNITNRLASRKTYTERQVAAIMRQVCELLPLVSIYRFDGRSRYHVGLKLVLVRKLLVTAP